VNKDKKKGQSCYAPALLMLLDAYYPLEGSAGEIAPAHGPLTVVKEKM
jgi:hypothetical protein